MYNPRNTKKFKKHLRYKRILKEKELEKNFIYSIQKLSEKGKTQKLY